MDITGAHFSVSHPSKMTKDFMESIDESIMDMITYNNDCSDMLRKALAMDKDCALPYLLLIFQNLRDGNSKEYGEIDRHFASVSRLIAKGKHRND